MSWLLLNQSFCIKELWHFKVQESCWMLFTNCWPLHFSFISNSDLMVLGSIHTFCELVRFNCQWDRPPFLYITTWKLIRNFMLISSSLSCYNIHVLGFDSSNKPFTNNRQMWNWEDDALICIHQQTFQQNTKSMLLKRMVDFYFFILTSILIVYTYIT